MNESYIQNIIALQTKLYVYILTLLADTEAADDVLQEANLVLLRKAGEFTEGTNFEAWAFRIARVQCLAYWKVRSRDRLKLDEGILHAIANRVEPRLGEVDARTHALRTCLGALPARQRELLENRYSTGRSVKEIARQFDRPEPTVSQMLYRIRTALLRCIRLRLANEGESPQ
jgi:RNA polymerase sigma-70 factor, ECF subfamily